MGQARRPPGGDFHRVLGREEPAGEIEPMHRFPHDDAAAGGRIEMDHAIGAAFVLNVKVELGILFLGQQRAVGFDIAPGIELGMGQMIAETVAERLHRGRHAAVHVHRQLDFMFAHRAHDGEGFGLFQRHRLFADDVLAAGGGAFDDRAMGLMAGGDFDDVDFGVVEHGFEPVDCVRHMEFGGDLPGAVE
ncbi:hypothetical protein SDC9_94968 [bioreactor metagenome]|uniref:Uncharacterized protein n=1 Tax=bioreactor metagenome TaxID=1076179 RepID=A0A645AEZ1_9ZZZZ